MLRNEIPLLEFDADMNAVINPELVVKPNHEMPEHCVLCFFAEAIEKVLGKYAHERIDQIKAEGLVFPVYSLDYHNRRVALVLAGAGAPLAAMQIEELIALGARMFMICGSAGVLQQEIAVGHLIIPSAAVRDEGVSYHYVAPARTISADESVIKVIERALERNKLPFIRATTWTTDAFYRETAEKVACRRAEGCVTVEMEAAAYMAVAQFRGVRLGQILYAGDNLGEVWDNRSFYEVHDVRAQLLDVTLETCLEL